MVLLGGVIMDLHEMFRLGCFIGLLLDTVFVIVDGIIFKRKYDRGDFL